MTLLLLLLLLLLVFKLYTVRVVIGGAVKVRDTVIVTVASFAPAVRAAIILLYHGPGTAAAAAV